MQHLNLEIVIIETYIVKRRFLMKYRKIAVILLILSVINLTFMIPGGPVDTRKLSTYSPIILASFNIFLTLLGILSIVTPVYMIKNHKWAHVSALVGGIAYFLVYLLDLLGIFPKSPDAFPIVLLVLEIVGLIISMPLIVFSYLALKQKDVIRMNQFQWSRKKVILIVFFILFGISIVVFSTVSAMNS